MGARTEVDEIRDALMLDGAPRAARRAALKAAPRTVGPLTAAAVKGSTALTRRQLETIQLVAQGLTNRQIAGELGVSAHTVKRHLSNVFAKADLTSRAQAAVLAGHLHRT